MSIRFVALLLVLALPAPAMASGIGFWLDASTSTPTFRVGDPNGNRLVWDGTELTVKGGPVVVNEDGIRISPTTSGSYVTDNGFSFVTGEGLTTGPLGVYATDSASLRGISIQSLWSGGGAPTNQRTELLSLNGTTRIGVSANIGSAGNVLTLESTIGGSVGSGVIDVVGLPNFRGATSGSAGAIVGYINIQVNGTNARIAVYAP